MMTNFYVLQRSAAHLLAKAVSDLFPQAILVEGDSSDLGFYYNFFFQKIPDKSALEELEEKMYIIINEEVELRKHEMLQDNARDFFKHRRQIYKANLLKGNEPRLVKLVQIDDFYDFCDGQCVDNAKEVPAFALTGIFPDPHMTPPKKGLVLARIEGVAASDKRELKKRIKAIETSKKIDHRILGQDLDLFSYHNDASQVSFFWHPKGTILFDLLMVWWRDSHALFKYFHVKTPVAIESNWMNKLGYYPKQGGEEGRLQIHGQYHHIPHQLTPQHALLFSRRFYSYRELPVRYAECKEVMSSEIEKLFSGMFRSRIFTSDIVHIFCMQEHLREELISSLHFMDKTIKMYDFYYRWFLVSRGSRFAGTIRMWESHEQLFSEVLTQEGFDFVHEKRDEAYFGPRIEGRIIDHLGREWVGPSIAFDYLAPEQFGLRYQGADDEMHVPLLLKRSIFGSLERFVASLIEHYRGQFPLWMAPEQVRVLPVGKQNHAHANEVYERILSRGFRCRVDFRNETLGARIYQAGREKIPYILIVGNQEEKDGFITVRTSIKQSPLGTFELSRFLDMIEEEVKTKAKPHEKE